MTRYQVISPPFKDIFVSHTKGTDFDAHMIFINFLSYKVHIAYIYISWKCCSTASCMEVFLHKPRVPRPSARMDMLESSDMHKETMSGKDVT